MSLIWVVDYKEPVVAIVSFTLLYLFYHFGVLSSGYSTSIAKSSGKRIKKAKAFFFQKIAGGLLFGLIPALISKLYFKKSLADYGFVFNLSSSSLLLILGICIVLFPVLYLYTRLPAVNAKFSDAQPERLSPLYIIVNASSWIFYLTGYEFCIRGFLLFTLLRCMGDWPSIMAVTSIYTLIHIPKGLGEAGGSFLMGILFGAISVSTGTILIPIIVHIFIALSTDTCAVIHRAHLSRAGNYVSP